MNNFDARRFERVVFEKTKSPSEKKRLKRRLEERKQRKQGVPIAPKPAPKSTPNAFADQPRLSYEEHKVIRVTRHTRKFRQKIKCRQQMAANSGLPELVARSGPNRPEQARRATQARASARATTEGCPRNSVVESGTAEEIIEVSLDTRQRTPDVARTEDIPPWQ